MAELEIEKVLSLSKHNVGIGMETYCHLIPSDNHITWTCKCIKYPPPPPPPPTTTTTKTTVILRAVRVIKIRILIVIGLIANYLQKGLLGLSTFILYAIPRIILAQEKKGHHSICNQNPSTLVLYKTKQLFRKALKTQKLKTFVILFE